MTTELIRPSVNYINVAHSDKFVVNFSNMPSLETVKDLRLYDNMVKSLTIPDYNMEEIYSDFKGNRIRHPIGGWANIGLSTINIIFKVSEDMKNYCNLFLWMQALKYGRADIFNTEEEYFRLNTIKAINLSILDNQKRTVVLWRFTNAFLLSLSSITLNMGSSEELDFTCTFSYEEVKFETKEIT